MYDPNATTSGHRTIRSSANSPPLPNSIRHGGQATRFDPLQDVSSPTNLSNIKHDGSPRALKQHVDSISAKNHQLETALREETLANEEQRNYIQILKNVIEQKLERDGIRELLAEATRKRR